MKSQQANTPKDTGRLALSLSDRWSGPAPDTAGNYLETQAPAVCGLLCWRGAAGVTGLCWVQLGLAYLDFVQKESCGRCTPCRTGTHHMRDILARLRDGAARPGDLHLLRALAENVEESAWCGVANTIRDPMLGLLELGAEDFARHARGETCPPITTAAWMAAPCRSTCPAGIDCPTYLFQAGEYMPHLATATVRRDNPLPGVIGRTCPHPCENNCTLIQADEPIAINAIKRWAADHAEGLGRATASTGGWELTEADTADPARHAVNLTGRTPTPPAATAAGPTASDAAPDATAVHSRKHVAVVGAGPAGLSAAYYLARAGFAPVIYEGLPVPGGMLYVGIPEYRLPKAILRQEVALIEREGVEIRYESRVGRDTTFAELLDEFPAVFIGIGAHAGRGLGVSGEELMGSMDAIDFLRRVALGETVEVGERVLVIGGGNSAMDAARTCIRLGVHDVTVVYRRDRGQMPANPWEIVEAEEEGVRFHFLAAPLQCEGTTRISGLVCQPMELGAPDDSGRLRPVPAACDPISFPADTVIGAVGQRPDFAPFLDTPGFVFNRWNYLECDEHTLMTDRPGIFVGGDAVSGGGLVIEAIAAGKRAAVHIERFLSGQPVVEDTEYLVRRVATLLGAQDSRHPLPLNADWGHRAQSAVMTPAARITSFAEAEKTLTDPHAHGEAKRCLRCHRPLVVALSNR
ncbi:MAG: FAD-dependent oxidoreductase [Actinobacteria bacterium]|nr:FAD-dependent oxidoreductase [Actinomycetota bacterium]